MRASAFSLIELMVVIAIIALLASIATPTYRAYLARSMVASEIPVLQQIAAGLQITHETSGSFPQSFTFLGTTITNGAGDIALPANNIGATYAGIEVSNGTGVLYYVYFTDSYLGLPISTGNAHPGNNLIRSGIFINSQGLYEWVCTQSGDVNDMPYAYISNLCACDSTTDLTSVFTSASGPCYN